MAYRVHFVTLYEGGCEGTVVTSVIGCDSKCCNKAVKLHMLDVLAAFVYSGLLLCRHPLL